MGQLVGEARLESVDVLYVDAGARYLSPESDMQQLLAITSGSCTVDVDHSPPIVLGTFSAAVSNPHERWSATATEPVVALLMQGFFEVWALAVTKTISVVPYDEAWPRSFDLIRKALEPFVTGVALRIDHVGSTAVTGLAAKPIIDIDIVASNESDVPALIEGLKLAGYRWRGDLGVTGREAFSLVHESELPEHHLYVVAENNRAHLDHLLLRDELRNDRQARDDYAALKISNVEVANGNMDIYVAAKAAFVANVLTRARRVQGLPPVDYWDP